MKNLGVSDTPAANEPDRVPAAQAIAGLLCRGLSVIEKKAPLVLADKNPADLHKLRIAVRQSRALLKATGVYLPAKVAKHGKKELRWLGKITTPVRDLDVLLAGDARQFSTDLQAALQAERQREWTNLAATLQSERFTRFCKRWRADLVEMEPAGPAFRRVADAALLAAAERFVTDAQNLAPDSPPEMLHALRKDGKQFRYLLEFFRNLYPSAAVKALLPRLKRAQDGLGLYQDLTAHTGLLSGFEEARPYLEALAAEEPARRVAAMAALAPFREAGSLMAYRELTGRIAPPMQRTLVLWRHAKSDRDGTALADIERPLAPRGHKVAPAMAAWIAKKWPADAVICSPARRTVETWGYLAPLLPESLPVRFDARAYLAESSHYRALIAETSPDVATLLVIGHNPGLEDLAAELATLPGEKFATGTAAVLQFEGDWRDLTLGGARLRTFRRPKRP